MELVFLGTGAGFPSKERNVSCCVLNLMRERGVLWVFDCGEATQQQFLKTTLKLSKIEKIFISHLHGDHLFGLLGLLASRSFISDGKPLTVYGPEGIKLFLETVLQVSSSYISYPLEIVEIKEGVIFEDEQFIVSTAALKHRITSYGFRIVEQDKQGSLDVGRLEALGITMGAVYQQLKRGEVVILEDGRVVDGKDFLKPSVKGKVVAIFGDTEPTPSQLILAKEADVVVHEATMEGASVESAKKHGHSTTLQTATMAKQAGVKRLIITHISTRYGKGRDRHLLSECRTIFANTELASDLAVFTL